MNKVKSFVSAPEAAKICGVSRVTILRWIKSGKINAEQVGRNFVVPVSELAKYAKKAPPDRTSEIEVAVKKVVEDYGETLRLLAKE